MMMRRSSSPRPSLLSSSPPSLSLSHSSELSLSQKASSSPQEQQQHDFVSIRAPCTMEAGYTFFATFEDNVFPVTVPQGGVQEGQHIHVPYAARQTVTEVTPLFLSSSSAATTTKADVRTSLFGAGHDEHWKSGLFDCCRLGICHVVVWNAFCCPQILMAQVLTRLHLDWLGRPHPPTISYNTTNKMLIARQREGTFSRILLLVALYWSLTTLLAPLTTTTTVTQPTHMETTTETSSRLWWWSLFHNKTTISHMFVLQVILYNVITILFLAYTWIVLNRLRKVLRQRYTIPITSCCCGDCEDCCVPFWCACCFVAQAARQTEDCQDGDVAACCSPTGLIPKPEVPKHHSRVFVV